MHMEIASRSASAPLDDDGLGQDCSAVVGRPATFLRGSDPKIAIAAEGALLQGGAQIFKIVCSFVSTVALVRILTPVDFGIIAMAAPFVGFLALFQNLGLSQAAVQARALDEQQATALFVYNLAAAAILALLLLAIGPVVAHFYGIPAVGMITAFSGLSLLVTAFSMQHAAWSSRHLQFGILTAADIISTLVGTIATIVLALWLHSFWALAFGTLAGALATTVFFWARVPWRPVREVKFFGTRELFTFGANLTGFSLVNFLVRNFDNLLVGKFWGAHQLGLYDRSYRLMMFPIQSINAPLGRVMLPTLARLADQPERYRRTYLTAIGMLAFVSMPGVLAAAICSEEVVGLLLGRSWSHAAPIFRWLSLAALFAPISNTTGWLFISSNRGSALFKWGLFSGAVTLAAFAAGLPWGAEGVALAFFGSQVALLPILIQSATHDTPVMSRDLYACFLPTIVGAAVCWPAHSLLLARVGPIAALGLVTVLCYLCALIVHCAAPTGREMLARQYRMVLLGLSRFVHVRMKRHGA